MRPVTKAAATPRSSFRFRGRSFLALVLSPEMPVGKWLGELDGWISRSPGFFNGKPLVLDASGLTISRDDAVSLIAELSSRNIQILGIEGGDPSWTGPGLPPLLKGGRTASVVDVADPATPPPVSVAPPRSSALLVDKPVRSGQSIVHPEGDVAVIGSVASGAEIVAGGSIHVYGTLRGRAIAGTYGDAKARIFCRRLEAELIAIDGYYKVADELEPHMHKKPIHAWLDSGKLNITTLD
jgi:septum site-determining protein MinC